MRDFCPNCFASPFGGRCPQCGYLGLSRAENHMLLPPGILLYGRYLVGRVLGAGGFGVTYLALDEKAKCRVAVKEYLPASFAVRAAGGLEVSPSSRENRPVFEHGLDVFGRESQTLRRFAGNQSVVQVLDYFAENGTAYFVMEYLDGVNLGGLTRSLGGRLPYALALEVLCETARTLAAVHAQGMLHRDVSPENIFVTKDGRAKLIDFGATRFFMGEKSRSLSVVLKPGFAPPEQYSSKGNQGPWTDLYALCATFYAVLSGARPPDAPERLAGAALAPLEGLGVPANVAAAVAAGMQPDYRKRPQTMQAFLSAAGAGAPARQPPAAMASAKGTPYVQRLRGAAAGDRWLIPKNMPMTIGRSAEQCNIVLDDPNVSRVHCRLRYDEKAGMFQLTDLSTNGTLVQQGRLAKGQTVNLAPGGRFYILTAENVLEVGLA